MDVQIVGLNSARLRKTNCSEKHKSESDWIALKDGFNVTNLVVFVE